MHLPVVPKIMIQLLASPVFLLAWDHIECNTSRRKLLGVVEGSEEGFGTTSIPNRYFRPQTGGRPICLQYRLLRAHTQRQIPVLPR